MTDETKQAAEAIEALVAKYEPKRERIAKFFADNREEIERQVSAYLAEADDSVKKAVGGA